MMSSVEVERLKACYRAGIREAGVLEEVLPDLAEASAQVIAWAVVETVDGPTRDAEVRRVDPDLSVYREVLVEEIKRLRQERATWERR